jgi:C-terminal processing protease CtpA/Prc
MMITILSGFLTYFLGPVRVQVGLMMNGAVIDNMVIGGPAYNSEQLDKGDVILEVDGKPVNPDTLHEALLGADIPGTKFVVKVKKASSGGMWSSDSGAIKNVTLTRMATEVIADRRRMFELFTDLKVLITITGFLLSNGPDRHICEQI